MDALTRLGRQTDAKDGLMGRVFKIQKKSRVFKIEISMVSSSTLAAEICTDSHNRLLRRQHCSSLCEQSKLQCFASELRQMSARCADGIFRR